MQWSDALDLGHDLLKAHNLDRLYALTECKAETFQAYCDYSKHTIALNRKFVLAATEEHFTQVMLHEIAHAICGPRVAGHGKEWKATAKSIGYTGGRVGHTPLAQLKRLMSDTEAEALYAQMRNGIEPKPLPKGTWVVTNSGSYGQITDVKRVNYDVKMGRSTYTVRFSRAIQAAPPRLAAPTNSESWRRLVVKERTTTTAF